MEKFTVPFSKGETKIIAHRGLSGLYPENSLPAFRAAAKRGYFGIETDVHRTLDGKYLLIHDSTTGRVAEVNLDVEGSLLADLRAIRLKDGGIPREGLNPPVPEEYFTICKQAGKVSVFELKSSFTDRELTELAGIAGQIGQLSSTVFISFDLSNLTRLRALYPDQPIQFLTESPVDASLIGLLQTHRLDLDIRADRLNPAALDALHRAEITVNCWTVDDPVRAAELADMGVDMITSNILE